VLAIIAFTVAGKAGLKFRTLYGTYLRWPKNSNLYSLLSGIFSKVEFDKGILGAAIIIAAYK
jgi:demethylmenaquinone methyltransferase/2-methoxy-6-polyprenyl-1,4-benzoquinol methylase